MQSQVGCWGCLAAFWGRQTTPCSASPVLSLISPLLSWGTFPRTPFCQAQCRQFQKQPHPPKCCSTSHKTSLCLHLYPEVMLQVQSHLFPGALWDPWASGVGWSPRQPLLLQFLPLRGSPKGSHFPLLPSSGLVRIQLVHSGLRKCQFREDNCLIKI